MFITACKAVNYYHVVAKFISISIARTNSFVLHDGAFAKTEGVLHVTCSAPPVFTQLVHPPASMAMGCSEMVVQRGCTQVGIWS